MYNLKIKNVKQKSLSYNTFTYITRETIFRRVFKRYRNTFKKVSILKETCNILEATGCSDATLGTLNEWTVDDIRVYAHYYNPPFFSLSHIILFSFHTIYMNAYILIWIRLSINFSIVNYIYRIFLITTSNNKFNMSKQLYIYMNNFFIFI